ncbi:MAG: rhodanese-like domain-containing protein [Bacteroidota bacterium]
MLNRAGADEITVQDLKKMMDSGDTPFLLDVRQVNEHQTGNIGGTLITLNELPVRIDELAAHKDEKFVVYCRSGGRSGQAVQFLQANGYPGATNLQGGMLAWRKEIDSSLDV